MPTYLQPSVLARAEALGLKARQIVEGLRVGDHKSPFRGFSVEFVQHREYVPGDDIRHIDWKSYGRSERYTIKQYEQETNFLGHVLVDASASMDYGDGDENKLEFAKTLAASLAYLVVKQRDSVSLGVFTDRWVGELPSSGQMSQVNAVARVLEETEPRDKTGVGPLLQQVAERIRRRGLVFLISDCFDDLDSLMTGLRHLRFQGHEVTVFHVMHGDEIEFPFDGNMRFDHLEGEDRLKTRPHLIRPAYRRAVREYLDDFEKRCSAYGCDYVLMDTTKSLGVGLANYLVRRRQMGRL